MVVNKAESSNNCQAAKKFGVTECNVRRWRAPKQRLKDANSQRKSYRGPQSGRFSEVDRRVFEYVRENALWEEPLEAEQLGSDDSESEHSGAEDVCEGLRDIGGEIWRILVKFS